MTEDLDTRRHRLTPQDLLAMLSLALVATCVLVLAGVSTGTLAIVAALVLVAAWDAFRRHTGRRAARVPRRWMVSAAPLLRVTRSRPR